MEGVGVSISAGVGADSVFIQGSKELILDSGTEMRSRTTVQGALGNIANRLESKDSRRLDEEDTTHESSQKTQPILARGC